MNWLVCLNYIEQILFLICKKVLLDKESVIFKKYFCHWEGVTITKKVFILILAD